MKDNQVCRLGGQNKILIFSTAYFPFVGGEEITDRISDPASPQGGFEFDMITAKIKWRLPKQEKIGKVNVYRVGLGFNFDKFLLPFLGFLKAKKLEKENTYALTWSVMASFGGFLGLFFKWRNPQKPWLLILQEGDAPEIIRKKVGIFRHWFNQIFQKADYIQAISPFLLNWAREMGAQCEGRVVPNGVNVALFRRASDEDVKTLKNKLGIKENEKVIITASRLVYKNGVDDLIKAGQYLDFPFKIVVAGEGEDRKQLEYLTEKLNLKNKVLFLGYVKYEDLPKYYSIADVFVRASRSEGFGNVFLEALACGVLPIGTAVDGSAIRVLYERKAGLGLAENPEGMPREIANKIEKAVSDDVDVSKGIKKMIQNGQELIREEYTWDKISRGTEETCKNLVNKYV